MRTTFLFLKLPNNDKITLKWMAEQIKKGKLSRFDVGELCVLSLLTSDSASTFVWCSFFWFHHFMLSKHQVQHRRQRWRQCECFVYDFSCYLPTIMIGRCHSEIFQEITPKNIIIFCFSQVYSFGSAAAAATPSNHYFCFSFEVASTTHFYRQFYWS